MHEIAYRLKEAVISGPSGFRKSSARILEILLRFDRSGFLSNGVTMASLTLVGKMPCAKDKFASVAIGTDLISKVEMHSATTR